MQPLMKMDHSEKKKKKNPRRKSTVTQIIATAKQEGEREWERDRVWLPFVFY